MKYQSTRNDLEAVSSTHAVLQGLASDGGLFVRKDLEQIGFDWQAAIKKDAYGMAEQILSALLPEFETMSALVKRAYAGKFAVPDLTPLVPVGDNYILELFHGPTSAFKDVALSMLPQLITAAKSQEAKTEEIVILTATSGDTGKAALEGFRDVEGTRIIVFYPNEGVSAVQKAQMVTQDGANVCVCAVNGNFDDAQTAVKNTFSACADGSLLAGKNAVLSSANSINIGRLAPQVFYYFKAYADLVNTGRIGIGMPIDFVVPTGNFGDILAGYFAKLLGLPVGMLVCASNANDVLTEFIRTGHYDRRRNFYRTLSPSMDILVSSNLERLLYLLADCDAKKIADLMAQLKDKGEYQVDSKLLEKLQAEFWAGYTDDCGTTQTIGDVWQQHHYLCDTHTAVAWTVAEQYKKQVGTDRPVVVLSTASPYKFPVAVLQALGQTQVGDEFSAMEYLQTLTGVPIPKNLAGLREKTVRFTDVIEKDEILEYVLKKISEKC